MTPRSLIIADRVRRFPRAVEIVQGDGRYALRVKRGVMLGDDLAAIGWQTPWLPLAPAPWSAILADLELDSPTGATGWVVLSDTRAFEKPPQPRKVAL